MFTFFVLFQYLFVYAASTGTDELFLASLELDDGTVNWVYQVCSDLTLMQSKAVSMVLRGGGRRVGRSNYVYIHVQTTLLLRRFGRYTTGQCS